MEFFDKYKALSHAFILFGRVKIYLLINAHSLSNHVDTSLHRLLSL